MNILSLIILIFFKIYVKNISNYFYLLLILIILIINSIYFKKDYENFNSLILPVTNPSNDLNPKLPFKMDDEFKALNEYNKCLYNDQKKQLINNDFTLNTKCYKKKNINDCNSDYCKFLVHNIEDNCNQFNDDGTMCNKTQNCNYNLSTNKCYNKEKRKQFCNLNSNKCNYNETTHECEDKIDEICEYNNDTEQCESKSENSCVKPDETLCHLYDDENYCNNIKVLDDPDDECYKKTLDECETNSNCKKKFYNDIYKSEKDNSNFMGCYNLNEIFENLDSNMYTKYENISLDDLTSNINQFLYYGFIKNKNDNKGTGYIFKFNNIRTLLSSKINDKYCSVHDRFLGKNYYIAIYKKKQQCVNNKKKCLWLKDDKNIPCEYYDKNKCKLNIQKCKYDIVNNKCINRGTCYKKCDNLLDEQECNNEIFLNLKDSDCDNLSKSQCNYNPHCEFNEKCEPIKFKQRCIWNNNKCNNNF